MSNPTPTGQDEARRALAEALEYFRPHWATSGPVMLTPEKMRQHLAVIEAALLAPSLDRDAEEMRERAAKLCEEIAEGGVGRISVTAASASLLCAQNIRALPVPADLNEGGGK